MINQEQLDRIGRLATGQRLSEAVVYLLRREFPDIHFTYCMDDDVVGATPLLEERSFNLYLIDSSDHCLRFTQEMELASGVVVAEIEPD